MAAFQYKKLEQLLAKVASTPREAPVLDPQTGFEYFPGDIVTTPIVMEPTQLYTPGPGDRKVMEALTIIEGVLTPFAEDLDFKLRSKVSKDFDFLKEVVIMHGERIA